MNVASSLVLPRVLAIVTIAAAPACEEESDDVVAGTTSSDETTMSAETETTAGDEADPVQCDLVPDIAACEDADGCLWSEDHTLCLPECEAIDEVLTCLGQHPCYWDGQYCHTGPI